MFCQTDCRNSSIEAKSELFQKIQQNITRLLAIDNYKLLCEFVKDKSEDELSGLGLSFSDQCRRDLNIKNQILNDLCNVYIPVKKLL